MKDNQRLKRNALIGIVKSGSKLHIDISQYEKELQSIPKISSYKAPKPKKIKKTNKKIRVKSTHKLKSIRWKNGRLVLFFDKKLRNNQINYFTSYDKK